MKKLISLIAGLFLVGVVLAGTVEVVPFNSDDAEVSVSVYPNMSTGTIVTTVGKVDGYVEMIDVISGAGAAQTCAVVIATVPDISGQVPQILYSNLTLSGNVTFYPRIVANTTAGGAVSGALTNMPIFLAQETLKMYCWKSSSTNNATVKARVKTWR